MLIAPLQTSTILPYLPSYHTYYLTILTILPYLLSYQTIPYHTYLLTIAEFYRMARACAGHERDLLDEAALKVHLLPSPAISSHLSSPYPHMIPGHTPPPPHRLLPTVGA